MARLKTVFSAFPVVFLLSAVGLHAQVITFDEPPDRTVIDDFYADQGVRFSNPVGPGHVYARTSSFNVSPPNVVSIFETGLPPFYAFYGAVDAQFDIPQAAVSIAAAAVASLEPLGTPMNRPFLEAYDADGTFLGSVLFSGDLPTCSLCVTPFEVLTFSSPTANISKVRFSSQQSQPGPRIWGLFDDLAFTTEAPVRAESLGPIRRSSVHERR